MADTMQPTLTSNVRVAMPAEVRFDVFGLEI